MNERTSEKTDDVRASELKEEDNKMNRKKTQKSCVIVIILQLNINEKENTNHLSTLIWIVTRASERALSNSEATRLR